MTREGEVRWTTYSIFNGEERWKSEGIQLGGVRSARGVVGNWFDKYTHALSALRIRFCSLLTRRQELRSPWPVWPDGVLEDSRLESSKHRQDLWAKPHKYVV